MSANSRWIEYNIDAVGTTSDGGCKGTRGFAIGNAINPADIVTIGATTNKLYVTIQVLVAGSFVGRAVPADSKARN